MRGWPSCDRCGVQLDAGQGSGLCGTCDGALGAPFQHRVGALAQWLSGTAPGELFNLDRSPVLRLADVEPPTTVDLIAEMQRQAALYAKEFASDFDYVLAGMPATSEAWKAAVCPVGAPTHRIDDALLALNQRHESALADLHATKRERDELLIENARMRRKIEAYERGKRGQ